MQHLNSQELVWLEGDKFRLIWQLIGIIPINILQPIVGISTPFVSRICGCIWVGGVQILKWGALYKNVAVFNVDRSYVINAPQLDRNNATKIIATWRGT